MRHKVLFALVFGLFVLTTSGYSQPILPQHNDTLNHTQIMFEFGEVAGADYYTLNIFRTLDNQLITEQKTTSLAKMVGTIFNFGEAYYWLYKAFTKKGKILYESTSSSFYIKKTKWSDTNFIHMKSTAFNPKKMHTGFIIYDFGVITDKQGKIIWNLPQTDGTYRNLVINKDGSLTYNARKGTFETDLQGKITWEAPFLLADTIKVKNYHHDIKKLSNGNYLCLAERDLGNDNNIYNAVFEINRQNQLQWYWDEVPFYQNRKDSITSNHVNAIFMDEQAKEVYLSNRNLNSVTRLSINSKPKVNLHIGKGYIQDSIQILPQELFSGQHAVSITKRGTILLFNNNTAHPNTASSVLEFKKPQAGDKEVTLLWRHLFQFANPEENYCAKSGDADVLPNGNILITSGANNRVFEVSKNNTIVWENISLRRDQVTDAFTPQSSYRSHFCSSLYPNYFTVQQLNTQISKRNKITLKINNDGSEEDTYLIALLLPNGIYKEISQIKLSAGREKLLFLNLGDEGKKNCTIKVSSKNNSLKSKQLIYTTNSP